MNWLWPIRTGKTFFDTSSIIHLCAWVFLGSGAAYAHWRFSKGLVACMLVALGFEVVEKYVLEVHYPLIWQHPESNLNRWVSDPFMCLLGLLLAYWLVKVQ